MSRNTEIKARVPDLRPVESRAQAIATGGPEDLFQDDTFFPCPRGRLKLRDFGDGSGQLIHYDRADEAGPKVSEYVISATAAPASLREALARAFGVLGRVVKRRRVYLVDRTRVHLDQVEGLGAFVELEVVLRDDEAPRDGEAVARELMAALGIQAGQLVTGAYLDLLAE